jgi:Fanconi anemia group M protein
MVQEKESVTVIADIREPKELLEMINAAGARVVAKQLSVGDYIASERVAVERKARPDFEQSIIDGRLFSQVERIKERYERPVVIIEGSAPFERLDERAIMGAIASLISEQGVSIIFSKDMKRTAEIVFALARYEQVTHSRAIKEFYGKKQKDSAKSKMAMVEAVYGIGPKAAGKIISRFGSIAGLAKASKADIQGTVGEKKGGWLWEVLNV